MLYSVYKDLEDIAVYKEVGGEEILEIPTTLGTSTISETATHWVLDTWDFKGKEYCSKSLEDPKYISFKKWLYANFKLTKEGC